MATNAVDVELDQKDALMLTNGDSNLEPSGQELGASPPAGEAAHGMSDQRIGKAETLTMGEFREEVLQTGGGGEAAEAERAKHKTG